MPFITADCHFGNITHLFYMLFNNPSECLHLLHDSVKYRPYYKMLTQIAPIQCCYIIFKYLGDGVAVPSRRGVFPFL